MSWQPRLGAWLADGGVRFRVWAPEAERVSVRFEDGREVALGAAAGGYHEGVVRGAGAGARYRYVMPSGAFPDPASRFQPDGVHGPSEVVDPRAFAWGDQEWSGLALERLVTYELHIGTWTPEGTFAAAAGRLASLVDLGVTAVQLLPVADFPGARNWGYDGVALFAPARCYGRPEELQAFVDRAHRLGIGVILDVVYNHFGPDGAYHAQFSRQYFTEAHRSAWGAGINLDGPGSEAVRQFLIESAQHWVHEYHVDGFRLDATHALHDDGPRHFLAEYSEALQRAAPAGKHLVLIAEDHRNLARLLQSVADGGYGFDGVLADDFHHEVRRLTAGDSDGYYEDYRGSASDLAVDLEQGWLFTGQSSSYWGEVRGTQPDGIALPHCVHCIQNHDQVGNRALGDRLDVTAGLPAMRAATALLLCSAATPMLFMGQEWAASTPFRFFTDHAEALGRLVTEGRRNEFKVWAAFQDPAVRERIPDPQALATFEASRLQWAEREAEPYASMLRLTTALLHARRKEPALRWGPEARQRAWAPDEDTVALLRTHGDAAMLLVARLRGAGEVVADVPSGPGTAVAQWERVLTTEDAAYAGDDDGRALPVAIEGAHVSCLFGRPGAVLLRGVRA